ncbi:FAD-binding oxidoreductase [Cryptosporangium aurantiacum]|uniref:FAD/FMN-containing dehydrogenase n=1 Tax=Cryptosporangium aurantiacum TaxID=134849 RepID=A0A1M7RM13_9ACTN|nr:FAD-binding oxidoreductase [Cryptosporangium aurantiacum]SHN47221.1 FAD/FMN-containing dehydrogenase [Cryptosporangium aurantiacum]
MKNLRSAVRGRVLLPGDAGFADAARPWNLAVEQPVAAVVDAEDADDVAALVSHARAHGLTVAAQPSGHGATGDVEGVVLLRIRRLDELRVDPDARTARVGAGVTWGQVQAVAGPHGLTGLPGSSPAVSVVGYTLGGGLSWFGRKYGWAADSVTAFDVVDADGRRARVTAETDAELFWALRGGGGDFAIVTAVEFGLHPAPALYGGRVLWPADRAPDVLAAFRDLTTDAPDELTVWADLLQFPGAAPLVAVDATYLGDPVEGRALLRALDEVGPPISDGRSLLPIADVGAITAEPVDPAPGLFRGELLTGLDDAVLKAVVAAPIDPLLSVQIRQLGGALAGPSDSPHGPLTEPYAIYLFGAPTPATAAAIRAREDQLIADLGPHVGGRKPFTFLAPGESVSAAFHPGAVARLRAVKDDRDPERVFRSNFPVHSGQIHSRPQ